VPETPVKVHMSALQQQMMELQVCVCVCVCLDLCFCQRVESGTKPGKNRADCICMYMRVGG